jgi:hypothetical protein
MLCSSSLYAQTGVKKIVVLRTSERISGEIIEAVPDQYVKIRLADNTIRTIQADDIERITDDDRTNARIRAEKRANAPLGLSIIGSVFAGYDLASGLDYLIVEPTIVTGLRIKQHRLGIGLGLIYGTTTNPNDPSFGPYSSYGGPSSMASLYYFPVFLNYHGDYGRKKVCAALDVSAGYPVSISKSVVYGETPNSTLGGYDSQLIKQTGEFYAELSPGVSFRLSPGLMLNVSATIHLLLFQEGNEADYVASTYRQTDQVYSTAQRLAGAVGGSIKIIY